MSPVFIRERVGRTPGTALCAFLEWERNKRRKKARLTAVDDETNASGSKTFFGLLFTLYNVFGIRRQLFLPSHSSFQMLNACVHQHSIRMRRLLKRTLTKHYANEHSEASKQLKKNRLVFKERASRTRVVFCVCLNIKSSKS